MIGNHTNMIRFIAICNLGKYRNGGVGHFALHTTVLNQLAQCYIPFLMKLYIDLGADQARNPAIASAIFENSPLS